MMTMTDKDTMTAIGLGMSNLGPTIDEGLAEALKKAPRKVLAQYAGWDFCGYVWFDSSQFVCQVWTYGSRKEEIAADSLEDIMTSVSEKYGAE